MFDTQRILRAQGAVFALAVLGIIIFVVMYFFLRGFPPAPRLFISMLVPPLLIALVVIAYASFTRKNKRKNEELPPNA